MQRLTPQSSRKIATAPAASSASIVGAQNGVTYDSSREHAARVSDYYDLTGLRKYVAERPSLTS